MNIQRATPVNDLLARLIFLILPTAMVGYFLLDYANAYYAILNNQAVNQALYFAAGMGLSAIFYAFRFRFLPTMALLLFGFYVVYKGLDQSASGEFDAFFIARAFQVFAILFSFGWLMGWGFLRMRYWSVVTAAAVLSSCILVIAKMKLDSAEQLLRAFAPVLLYAIYIIFTAEQIYSYKDKSQKFWWYLSRRLVMFSLLAVLMLGGIIYLMQGEISETVASAGGGGKQGENSMLKKNKDGSFDLSQYSKLRGSLGRNNELLFAAHIDNFFPDSDIPNPLYLTAFYYTKFDTLTETFTRDEKIPFNDLFEPKPGDIPLFATKSDSSVIKNSLGPKARRIVDVEIFNKKLSGNTYLAPSTGYFVQPITVEKDFREEFKSAFRTKSYVSELNSAYFVYNSDDEALKMFQEQRFNVLRKVTSYEETDASFMKYYTFMPHDAKFGTITQLADSVTRNAKTPVDKVIAIRDYFLSKDENGDPLYKYTDNPGIPDLPSASKLMYFLFENRQGYCAYYAGATLFMLRSLGIPSRIAVGFLTVDRSDKNKGWYWYYADQAHAWVQVYFPGYGWLDFDTTVGNSDAQESPQPDKTPPMQPPKAWLAADGKVVAVDTAKRLLTMKLSRMVFHDKEYEVKPEEEMLMDVHIAAIRRDSIDVPLASIEKGEDATAVSYAEAIRKMREIDGEKGTALVKRIAAPAPIDEVYLKRHDTVKPEEKPQTKPEEKPVSPVTILLWIGIGLAALIIVMLALPSLIYQYFKARYQRADADKGKAYWAFRASSFYLHQIGIFRNHTTPMKYAMTVVDPAFGTQYGRFMTIYLKQKYAKQPLNSNETDYVSGFLQPFISAVKSKTKTGTRIKGFLNPLRTVSYFVQPEDE